MAAEWHPRPATVSSANGASVGHPQQNLHSLRDSDIDFSDEPELGPDFFANAILRPGPNQQITLRLDPDVLAFFRKHGRVHQTTITAVLRKYMEARELRAWTF